MTQQIKHYNKRNCYDLDCENGTDEPFYSNHVQAMTSEHLDYKSEIAAELAVRDAQITYLINLLLVETDLTLTEIEESLPQFLENY